MTPISLSIAAANLLEEPARAQTISALQEDLKLVAVQHAGKIPRR
jgi:hypothetical protein